MIVGPPPVVSAGDGHLRRALKLAEAMAALCDARRVPFIPTTQALADAPAWRTEALAGDGAHPADGGYRLLADLVLAGPWHRWIEDPASR